MQSYTDWPQVFGGKITSSFDTPQTQPDPGEPSFSTSKYIPPALCPNKKPRTEIFFELSPTFNPMSSLSSTGLPTASLEYKSHYPAHRASISQGQPTPHREYESRRRPPLHQGYKRRQTDASPNGVKCQFARGSGDESRPRTNGAITKDTYRSPDRTAVPSSWLGPPYVHPPTTLARPSVDHFAPPFTDQYALDADHEMRRRSSVASPCDFAPPPPVDPTRAGHPLSSSPRYLLSLNECSPSKEYLIFMDRGRPQPPGMMASNNRVGFQDRQAMFFISSHRDYQQGKRRKRSNLPKQSTDIMKTWFDQVRQCNLRGYVHESANSVEHLQPLPFGGTEGYVLVCEYRRRKYVYSKLTKTAAGNMHQHDTSQQLVH